MASQDHIPPYNSTIPSPRHLRLKTQLHLLFRLIPRIGLDLPSHLIPLSSVSDIDLGVVLVSSYLISFVMLVTCFISSFVLAYTWTIVSTSRSEVRLKSRSTSVQDSI
jgi:hypothetical protein